MTNEEMFAGMSKEEAIFHAISTDGGKPACFDCSHWGWVDNAGKLHWECSVDECDGLCREEFAAWMAEDHDEKQKIEEIRRR